MRNLIDKALNGATSCCRLSAPHHRRDGPVCFRPSTRGKVSWPSPGGGRGNTRMTYEVSNSSHSALRFATSREADKQASPRAQRQC